VRFRNCPISAQTSVRRRPGDRFHSSAASRRAIALATKYSSGSSLICAVAHDRIRPAGVVKSRRGETTPTPREEAPSLGGLSACVRRTDKDASAFSQDGPESRREEHVSVGPGLVETRRIPVWWASRPPIAGTRLPAQRRSQRLSAHAADRAMRPYDVVDFRGADAPARLDITIDGADQVAPSGWLVKGVGRTLATGGCGRGKPLGRDRLLEQARGLAFAADPARPAVFGLANMLIRPGEMRLRAAPLSPDEVVIADYLGEFDDPQTASAYLLACLDSLSTACLPLRWLPRCSSAAVTGWSGSPN
jgi:hypothetical protein